MRLLPFCRNCTTITQGLLCFTRRQRSRHLHSKVAPEARTGFGVYAESNESDNAERHFTTFQPQIPGLTTAALLLLHGIGADERAMLPLAHELDSRLHLLREVERSCIVLVQISSLT